MKNQYTVNKKLFMEWAKEYHLVGARIIISFVLFCLIGLISLARILFSIVYNEYTLLFPYVAVFILSVYYLFFSRFRVMSNRFKTLARIYGVDEWIKTVEFGDDVITIYDHNNISVFQYSNIKKIKEKDNRVAILLKTYAAIRVYKDKFIEGNWEECKKKIESMMK
ncbi:MAG: hypothetical protein IKU25_09280 [Clostridia bacterium]|nr:hypothetical protein [Clostridia bacterium]